MSTTTRMTGRRIVAIAAVALFILHQDFWFWESTALVFGFLPIGLAYHALYSILAAGLWAAAVKFAWPDHIERFAEAGEPEGGESSGGSVRS